MSSLSILGMARYLEAKNDNLFSNLVLPEGLDKETLENNILVRTADFEVLYSDADFVKEYIGIWSKKWLRTFTKWYDALQINYNPLENYDRMEEWNDTSHNTSSDTSTSTINADASTSGATTANTSGNIESLKSAFDSPNYQPYENSINNNQSSTTSNAITSNNTNNSSRSNSNADIDAHRTGRTHGNIGVTTSQQMLQSELELAEWNLIEKITDIFVQEFCIPVYY